MVRLKGYSGVNLRHQHQVIRPHRNFPNPEADGGELNSVFSIPIASLSKLAEVRCPGLCAETLFVLLLKFGAVLSIICGFWWRFIFGPIYCSLLLSCGRF